MSTETVPKGYKRTEVGVIPEDWELANIASVVREPIRNGYSPVCPAEDTGIWILSLAAVTNNGFNENGIKPAPPTDPKINENLLAVDDIVVSRSNTPERVGLAGIYNGIPEKCAYPDLLMRVRLNSKILSGFLLSQLLSRTGRKYFLDNARGSSGSMVKIDRAILQNFPVLLPSEPEQQAIAAALSDADALIESLEQLIAKKRQIKQGAMQELLTGKRRLPGFTGKWETKRFREVAQLRKTRIDPRQTDKQNFCVELEHIGQGTGTLLGSGVTNEYSSLKSVFYKGDVLFGKLRAYLQKYWMADCDGVCSTEIWVLFPKDDDFDSRYLYHLVTMPQFIEIASSSYGTHMPRSDWNVVKEYEFLSPTPYEQTAIAAVLSDIDTELEALEGKLDKARQVKQGMMQQLLTGKVRLV